MIVRDAATGATLDFGASSFDVPRTASVTGIRPNAEVYRQGDTMSIVTRASGALEGLRMRVRLTDDLDRVVQVEEKTTKGERYFFYPLEDFVGRRVQVTAELVDAKGRVVDQVRHAPVPVVARERRQKEYQALLSFETPVHHQAALRLRRLREQGMTTGFTWGGGTNDELDIPRGYFGVYWYDRGPTTPEGMEKAIAEFQATQDFDALKYLAKKELFKRTGDKRFLVRRPCLDDPLTLRTLRDVSRTAARAKAVYGMDYYFVGDEGSLGSYADPVDFCFGPHTLASFRKWLQTRYDSLDALNRSWQSELRELGRDRAPDDGRGPVERPLRAVGRPPHVHGDLVRERVRDGARGRRRGRPGRPHRPLGNAGHDAVERLRLASARQGRRRLPLLQRREPVGDPPLFREDGGARGLLDGLRPQRRGGEARGLVGRAQRRPLPEPLLEPVDRQPGPHVLALRPRPRRRLPARCGSRGSASC